MLIDWFTVGAQIINFLLLVYLLKRFLYGPIIRAMEKREEMIAQRVQEAEDKRSEAVMEVGSYRQKIRELDERREEFMARSREEAEEQKRQMVRKARTETDDLKKRWLESVREEQAAFLHDLRLKAGAQVCAVAGRILADLADTSLEQRMLDVFVRRNRSMDDETIARISESAGRSGEGVVVSSAFELNQEMRQLITLEIQRQLAGEFPVSFRTSHALICGIELKAGGYAIGWNLNDYLKTVEEDARRMLEQKVDINRAVYGEQ